MTRNKKASAADEMLRQSVFSSIHLSTRLKSDVVQLTTPLCSNCGVSKAPAKKKPGSYYFSVYTNNSEPFVVWFKKREEPKGILWLRNYTVRKSSETNTVELASKSCHFKCAHKIKLSNCSKLSEWFQLLRDESRKQPDIGGYICEESFLDTILDDSSHKSYYEEEDDSKSDCETVSLSSSIDSEDKLSFSDHSVGSSSPVHHNCTSLLSYIKGSKTRSLTTSALPHLRVKETKKIKSTSLLISPQLKIPSASPQPQRKPLSSCDNHSSSDSEVADRWSWPTHK